VQRPPKTHTRIREDGAWGESRRLELGALLLKGFQEKGLGSSLGC